eukprot:PhF_6_TR42902/c0_g1_i1/m.65005
MNPLFSNVSVDSTLSGHSTLTREHCVEITGYAFHNMFTSEYGVRKLLLPHADLRKEEEEEDATTTRELQFPMFGCAHPAPISITDYITRFVRYSNCSTECVVVAFLYAMRYIRCVLTANNTTYEANSMLHTLHHMNMSHRLFLGCVVIAIKYREDTFMSNQYYARLGGISTAELNRMELEILNGI